MKIGIISSGPDMLTLFSFLSAQDHEYLVYYDDLHRPYGDKSFDDAWVYVQRGIDYLVAQQVDALLLPPLYELALSTGKVHIDHSVQILPLFQHYLLDYCFAHSLVGKIGIMGDFADLQCAQSLLIGLAKTYVLSPHQTSIKKFHFPFAYRSKETPSRKYYLATLSYSHVLVNAIIKSDLRYFKDAMTDTVIPFNYGYFHYQATISKFLNFKKIRFHTIGTLEKIFVSWNLKPSASYAVTIAYTGHPELLQRQKKSIWLLQKGKSVSIVRSHVSIP